MRGEGGCVGSGRAKDGVNVNEKEWRGEANDNEGLAKKGMAVSASVRGDDHQHCWWRESGM
jgi:hypothetical protein